jgi:hypothetical protein
MGNRRGYSLTNASITTKKFRIIHAWDNVGDDNERDVSGRSSEGELVYDDMPTLRADFTVSATLRQHVRVSRTPQRAVSEEASCHYQVPA